MEGASLSRGREWRSSMLLLSGLCAMPCAFFREGWALCPWGTKHPILPELLENSKQYETPCEMWNPNVTIDPDPDPELRVHLIFLQGTRPGEAWSQMRDCTGHSQLLCASMSLGSGLVLLFQPWDVFICPRNLPSFFYEAIYFSPFPLPCHPPHL